MTPLPVLSPYDGHHIKDVQRLTKDEAFTALEAAHKAYQDRDQWLTPHERITILNKFLTLMESQKDKLALQAAEEGGKPLMDSQVEAARAIQGVKVAIEQIGAMPGREIPMNLNPASAHRLAYTYRDPVGVVLSISAFNHPLNLIIHQVIPAVAVGAPVIVKPASATPLSCLSVVELLYESGLPKAWCQAVICENDVATQLVENPRVSFLSFIGSARVGWMLRSKLPPGAHCALEHGGAATVIVEPDADLDDALPLLVKGGFYHAGQVCVSVQKIFAHDSLCQTLAEQMAERASQLRVGDPTDPKTEVGPLIDPREVLRIDEWVKAAVDQGAQLLCGGKKISDTCYEPTVLLNPPEDANVTQREIFGPVVCLYNYTDRADAITRANSVDFAFQSAIFTHNIEAALDTVKRLNATAVMVNDHTAFRVDWMPFGGRRQSGLGMGGIPQSMQDMTYEKLMVLRSNVL